MKEIIELTILVIIGAVGSAVLGTGELGFIAFLIGAILTNTVIIRNNQ